MTEYWWLLPALALAGLTIYRFVRIWRDMGRSSAWPQSLGVAGLLKRTAWAVRGTVAPASYWWGAKIQAISGDERAALLARETRRLGLRQADGLLCPLCGAEISRAWVLTPEGRAAVGHGPIRCPDCDFRLDSCRHCVHFLPGAPRSWAESPWMDEDLTFGRCSFYKTAQPVGQAASPDVARRLRAQGIEVLRAPLPIADSYVPPDSCAAFEPARKRLRISNVAWPDARRRALLRLLGSVAPPASAAPAGPPAAGDPWLY